MHVDVSNTGLVSFWYGMAEWNTILFNQLTGFSVFFSSLNTVDGIAVAVAIAMLLARYIKFIQHKMSMGQLIEWDRSMDLGLVVILPAPFACQAVIIPVTLLKSTWFRYCSILIRTKLTIVKNGIRKSNKYSNTAGVSACHNRSRNFQNLVRNNSFIRLQCGRFLTFD